MKTEILAMLQWVLDYSILLSVQLVILLLLRPLICRYLGAANSYSLWLLPLVWLPFYFINWSTVNLQQVLSSFASSDVAGTVSAGQVGQRFALPLELLIPSFPEFTLAQSSAPVLWLWLSVLWLSGVLILLGREAYKIVRFNSFVDFKARPVTDSEAGIIRGSTNFSVEVPMVYLKDIESPALYGLFHPVLLLPEKFLSKYDADQRHIILSHEAVHLQRKDNFWNLTASLLRILFWFNPLLYLAHHYYRLDQELSCDAIALTRCNENQARHYARTLLVSVAQVGVVRHPPMIAAWENPKLLRERIQMIGHHLATNCRKSYVILSFLFFSLAGAGLTSCVSQNVSHQVEIADQAQARSAPAMERNDQVLSRRIYARIEEVMALRDSNEYEAAMEILSEIKALDDEGSLNTREQFVMWQFFANLYQIQERYEDAIIAYETMLTLQNLSQQQRQQALFYIASLNYVLRDYQEAIVRFEEYNRIGTEPDANAYLRIGTAHYLLEQYAEAIPPVLRSMEILQNKNETVPKNTYDLLRALYLTVEDYDAAMKVIEESLEFYNEEEDRVLLENIRANADGIPVNASASVILLQADRSNILNGAVNSADVEMLPIVKIIPEYPGRARIRGIEGWVLVNFIVTETGYVIEPEVIDAEPEYIFNRSALDAIEKFKFNPKQVDGAPVAVADVRYLFTYELDD